MRYPLSKDSNIDDTSIFKLRTDSLRCRVIYQSKFRVVDMSMVEFKDELSSNKESSSDDQSNQSEQSNRNKFINLASLNSSNDKSSKILNTSSIPK